MFQVLQLNAVITNKLRYFTHFFYQLSSLICLSVLVCRQNKWTTPFLRCYSTLYFKCLSCTPCCCNIMPICRHRHAWEINWKLAPLYLSWCCNIFMLSQAYFKRTNNVLPVYPVWVPVWFWDIVPKSYNIWHSLLDVLSKVFETLKCWLNVAVFFKVTKEITASHLAWC